MNPKEEKSVLEKRKKSIIQQRKEGKKKKKRTITNRKEKEEAKREEEGSKRKRKRPWRQMVRNRARRERRAEEESTGEDEKEEKESTNDENSVGEGEEEVTKKRKNKLGKEKRAKRRKVLGESEGTKSDGTEAEESDRSPLLTSVDASRFRFLNERLCSQTSASSAKLFEEDPDSFRLYHRGYRHQVSKWPVNPLEKIVLDLGSLPPGSVVADLGCGDAEIAKRLGERLRVHSFDLVASNERVLAADMADLPLESESVDVCVYCLSLMGTNLAQFFREAHRVLKTHGKIKIAEITSRLRGVSLFVLALEKMGFQLKRKKLIGDGFFVLMTFEKISEKMTNKRPKNLRLKPFLYKKR
ncbi:hypothetical protein niasHS_014770 [Heterodera schachtii]|uniref:Ribosomal RNA-processing protein 8 n=1 Tax=Heterodera schachtii TaxID=97005 RepID=A0ABD2II02_HETSC